MYFTRNCLLSDPPDDEDIKLSEHMSGINSHLFPFENDAFQQHIQKPLDTSLQMLVFFGLIF